MIEVCIFNKSNDVSRFDIFKTQSSLTVSTPRYLWRAALKQMSLSKCDWQWEENGKFDILVDSLLLEDTSWWVSYDQLEDGW